MATVEVSHPGGSWSGPMSGVPCSYAAERKSDGGPALMTGLYCTGCENLRKRIKRRSDEEHVLLIVNLRVIARKHPFPFDNNLEVIRDRGRERLLYETRWEIERCAAHTIHKCLRDGEGERPRMSA